MIIQQGRRNRDCYSIAFNKAIDNTQDSVLILTATYPHIIHIKQLSVSAIQAGNAGTTVFWWTIVIVRQGETASTITIPAAEFDDFYVPCDRVIISDCMRVNRFNTAGATGPSAVNRIWKDVNVFVKMKEGDRLFFLGLCDDAEGVVASMVGRWPID